MISSAALPKVALRRPPTPSPERSASCSVARPSQAASGRMAIAAATKNQQMALRREVFSAIAIGTKASSHLNIIRFSHGSIGRVRDGSCRLIRRSLAGIARCVGRATKSNQRVPGMTTDPTGLPTNERGRPARQLRRPTNETGLMHWLPGHQTLRHYDLASFRHDFVPA